MTSAPQTMMEVARRALGEKRHAEQQQKRETKRIVESHMRKSGGELMRQFNLNIAHSPRLEYKEQGYTFPGGTVVWRYLNPQGKGVVVEVATALQHPNDQYNKSTGRYQAACNFRDGQLILMRLPQAYKGDSPKEIGEYLAGVLLGNP